MEEYREKIAREIANRFEYLKSINTIKLANREEEKREAEEKARFKKELNEQIARIERERREQEEARLKREVSRLQEENSFLKKVATYFTKESK